MSTPTMSARTMILLGALNQRGIAGRQAKTILRRHSQFDIARQIDYYDHEIAERARLPLWAATPWLAHRIRHAIEPPKEYVHSSGSLSERLRLVPYRPGRADRHDATESAAPYGA